MIAILGIGNPGRSFKDSRHSAGLWCIDALARQNGISLKDRRRYTTLAETKLGSTQVVIAKSRTYMNDSGIAARYLVDRFHIDSTELLVVHDEMDLPVGTMRISADGSAAGHHGIESIIDALNTQNFPRLRLGVGHPGSHEAAIRHVLGPFSKGESESMHGVISRAVEAVICTVKLGVNAAMNHFNEKVPPPG